jgi:hypothetical protein
VGKRFGKRLGKNNDTRQTARPIRKVVKAQEKTGNGFDLKKWANPKDWSVYKKMKFTYDTLWLRNVVDFSINRQSL